MGQLEIDKINAAPTHGTSPASGKQKKKLNNTDASTEHSAFTRVLHIVFLGLLARKQERIKSGKPPEQLSLN